jgi:leucyl/phenylalanyl-tRNA---protein transferase
LIIDGSHIADRMSRMPPTELRADQLIGAYARGYFPMTHPDGQLYWHDPDPRAVFPLNDVRPNARLRRKLRSAGFVCSVDQAFERVMCGCADRETTWLSEEMIGAYVELHHRGFAHSVETWYQGQLVGGIYGVSLQGAFFGESMFNRANHASKAAFHHLMDHLRERRFLLFDSQYINDHTRSLGAMEIPRDEFGPVLAEALAANTHF